MLGRKKRSAFVAICMFMLVAPLAGRTLKVDCNGPPYTRECNDGTAYFSSIGVAIDNAKDGDEIAVWPGTYHESICFGGKAIRVYSTGGPDVTIIDPKETILDSCPGDAGWKFIDEGNIDDHSDWQIVWHADSLRLGQFSNIYSEPEECTTRRGTYALWQESFYWGSYSVGLWMMSGDNDTIGVMFRYQDHDNYYRFSWNKESSEMWLGKMQNGEFTILAKKDKGYIEDEWYWIEITAHGAYLEVSIFNNIELFCIDDSFAYGPVALYCWANAEACFDDVIVSKMYGKYHAVRCITGEGPNTVLEGFTITGSAANGPDPNDKLGGGMYNYGSSPTVINCKFTQNTADKGGAMCNN